MTNTEIKNQTCYTLLFTGALNQIQVFLCGDKNQKTQVYTFFDNLNQNEVENLISDFAYIDQFFPTCSHAKKFKHLADDLWSIKEGQIRIACFWRRKKLIAVYGIKKKDPSWRKQDLDNAIRQYRLCKENSV